MSVFVMIEVAVLGVLGLAALALGLGMVVRPAQRRYELLRPVTVAMLFACLWISGTGATNMLMGLAATPGPVGWQRVCAGLAELIVPSVGAVAVLTVAWGLAAIGLRKMP